MNTDRWDAAKWVTEFEQNGGVVLQDNIASIIVSKPEWDRARANAMCAELEPEGRWDELLEYTHTPERVIFHSFHQIAVVGGAPNSDERLIIQDYNDAMAKYRGQPSGFPPVDMCLELIQRDYFGLLDNEMEFSEASLAVCIREIAKDQPRGSVANYFLNGLANTLDQPDAPWQLKISRKKWAGKFRSVSESNSERALWALSALEFYEAEGWPTEAAIVKVGERLGGMSRASTFKMVKEGRRLQKLFADFPLNFQKSSDET